MNWIDRAFWAWAGVLLVWGGRMWWRAIRAALCGCWKWHGDRANLEVPRHWDVCGVWLSECEHCGRKWVYWETFCKLLKEAGE